MMPTSSIKVVIDTRVAERAIRKYEAEHRRLRIGRLTIMWRRKASS